MALPAVDRNAAVAAVCILAFGPGFGVGMIARPVLLSR
jgi:hypothetical protein